MARHQPDGLIDVVSYEDNQVSGSW